MLTAPFLDFSDHFLLSRVLFFLYLPAYFYLLLAKPFAMKQYCYFFLLLFLSACDITVKTNEAKEKTSSSSTQNQNNEGPTNSDADILNDIELVESGGLKVAQAYLTFDDGNLVPKTNKVPLSKTVNLNLVISDGWEIRDGHASIDATEIISTDKGEIILNAPNLFKTKPTMEKDDANRVFLKATIVNTRPDIEYFLINYRVWDKWSDAEVKGSYKLYVETNKGL